MSKYLHNSKTLCFVKLKCIHYEHAQTISYPNRRIVKSGPKASFCPHPHPIYQVVLPFPLVTAELVPISILSLQKFSPTPSHDCSLFWSPLTVPEFKILYLNVLTNFIKCDFVIENNKNINDIHTCNSWFF